MGQGAWTALARAFGLIKLLGPWGKGHGLRIALAFCLKKCLGQGAGSMDCSLHQPYLLIKLR